ncbi:hypothetical protein [Citrobacter freundii]|uniref:Uncharacterized protein n=1 Tax=Citrobacter freundii TaxID=546 RepID=A0A7G2IPM0_CITFR|nr:hypothetical protein [Citrobacter freundii]
MLFLCNFVNSVKTSDTLAPKILVFISIYMIFFIFNFAKVIFSP